MAKPPNTEHINCPNHLTCIQSVWKFTPSQLKKPHEQAAKARSSLGLSTINHACLTKKLLKEAAIFPVDPKIQESHKNILRKTWQQHRFIYSETQHTSCFRFSRWSVFSIYRMLSRYQEAPVGIGCTVSRVLSPCNLNPSLIARS